MQEISIEELNVKVHDLWLNRWLLLSSGDYNENDYNSMTVAWGSLGTMWNKPFAQIVVRPNRHTFGFTEDYDNFTLCTFPEEFRHVLKFMGTHSGKDVNKMEHTGITPIESKIVSSPSFKEADMILECRKIYFDDIKPDNFLDPSIHENYPLKDYHRIYFGEILKAFVEYEK